MPFLRHIALLLLSLLATLVSTFGSLHPAPETAPGDYFYYTPDATGPETSSTRNLCWEKCTLRGQSTVP